MEERRYCKKVVLKNSGRIVLGLVEDHDAHFLKVTTGKNKYLFAKDMVLEISQTDEVFRGE